MPWRGNLSLVPPIDTFHLKTVNSMRTLPPPPRGGHSDVHGSYHLAIDDLLETREGNEIK